MNALFIAGIALVLFIQTTSAQPPKRTEFDMHANGLLYSETDMKILRHMVDSLNLRFKTCDLSRPYYSFPQTRIFYANFKTNKFSQLIKDIEAQMSFNDLVNKYRSTLASVDTTGIIMRVDTNYVKGYNCMLGNAERGYEYNSSFNEKTLRDVKGTWHYEYSPEEKYSKASFQCWFFPDEFERKKLPIKYAALIQYVDCMIDTTEEVMLAKGWRERDKERPAFMNMLKYINDRMGKTTDTGDHDTIVTYFSFGEQYEYARQQLRADTVFRSLLNAAIEECIRNNTGNGEFESFVESMISKQMALDLKRNRIVYGNCSQDMSPRYHARDIAILAAETHSWEIFLRAHLDIMNDKFQRMTDGSYAYGRRETYLKELEELNLNVIDLILGLSLRADNTADNHYYGRISRLGRALAESKDRKSFEARAHEIMKDPELDEFNRGVIYIVYVSYLDNLDNKKEAAGLMEHLKKNESSYPVLLRTAISKLDPKRLLKERD
ncbi:MAG TPA: hypothetical protein VFZ47_07135 [Chitinophagaceae bacterium]